MLSESAIMVKLNQYVNTAEGKKKKEACLREHQRSGKPLASGHSVAGQKEMLDMANAFIAMIQRRLPDAIASVGATLRARPPSRKADGSYEVVVAFDRGALHRDSLENDLGYDGIDNIVALFNNGYAEGSIGLVWGNWASHDVFIHNKTSWEGLYFMQEAVEEFNAVYGAKFGAMVLLGSDYEQ